jgi:uncharacterized membrane protein ArfB
MVFVVQWLWYLGAFVAGSLIAWGVATVAITPASKEEALAALPGSREIGAR